MIRMLIALVLLMLGTFAQAQPRPDLSPREAENLRRHNEYPRWCQMYDRRDYWHEKRACGDDRECRYRVERKARRCGLR